MWWRFFIHLKLAIVSAEARTQRKPLLRPERQQTKSPSEKFVFASCSLYSSLHVEGCVFPDPFIVLKTWSDMKLRLHIRVKREAWCVKRDAWCVLHDSTCTSKCDAWCVKVNFDEGATQCGSPVAFFTHWGMPPYLSIIYKRLMSEI